MAASEGCLKRNDSWPGKPLRCGGISAVPSAPRLLRALLERCALWPRESSGALSTWKSRCCGRRRAVKAQKRQSEGRGVGMPAKWPNAILRGAVLSQRGMVFWTMMHGTGSVADWKKLSRSGGALAGVGRAAAPPAPNADGSPLHHDKHKHKHKNVAQSSELGTLTRPPFSATMGVSIIDVQRDRMLPRSAPPPKPIANAAGSHHRDHQGHHSRRRTPTFPHSPSFEAVLTRTAVEGVDCRRGEPQAHRQCRQRG